MEPLDDVARTCATPEVVDSAPTRMDRSVAERVDRDTLASHVPWVRAVARNLVRDPWGAEDVTQETLLAALASPPRDVPDERRLRAWLGRVAFNLSRLDARHEARRRAREARVARREALPSVGEEFDSRAKVNELMGAIAGLSELDRRTLSMRYFDDASTAEIAAETGLSELAVRKRIWRSRCRLREVLERGSRGRVLALLFPWSRLRSSLSWGAAASAAGLALWVAASPTPESRPELSALAPALTSAAVDGPGGASFPPEPGAGSPSARVPAGRRPLDRRPPEIARRPPVELEPTPVAFATGRVLDLEGQACAGLVIAPAAEPEAALATSDALGGFRVASRAEPQELVARGAPFVTIVPAHLAGGASGAVPPIVVAPGQSLRAWVVGDAGEALSAAEIALVCSETALAHIEEPVQLDSAVLRTFATDANGAFRAADLPRGEGLRLRIESAGYETLVADTTEIGAVETFVLHAAPELSLTGVVRHQDGRLARGATVRLGLAQTRTDEDGRFVLRLRGVQPDSALIAMDEGVEPVTLRAFGARVAGFVGSLEVVLGPEQDPVEGELSGPEPGGWLVAAYPEPLRYSASEAPAALTRSAPDGSFDFVVGRGAYRLYAVAPDALRVVRSPILASDGGRWELGLPATAAPLRERSALRTDQGRALAGERVEVRAHLDPSAPGRVLAWKELVSDELGALSFARDPEVAFELALVAARGSARPLRPVESQVFVLPRPSYLQVAAATRAAASARIRDCDGGILGIVGPLGGAESFAMSVGRSPVIEVPPEGRWLEVEGMDPFPISPVAGEVLRVRR